MSLLTPGSRVAVVAPSHAFNEERLRFGMQWARGLGLELTPLPHLLEPHRRFASAPGRRLASLTAALSDPAFDAVWIVRGGSGMLQLLDLLPYDSLGARPIIGFSDVTALFCALDAQGTGPWPLIHGPVLHAVSQTDDSSLTALESLLMGEQGPRTWDGEAWAPGEASGGLVGGNLTLLTSTCGTRHQLRGEGRIILIEEIGELPYRVERMVQQLISAGVFDGAVGIALGEFRGCRPPENAGWTLRDGLMELLAPLGLPVTAGLPVGHGPRNHPFVWDAPAHLAGGRLHFR